MGYREEYRRALENPEEYFGNIAERALYWKRRWWRYLEYEEPLHKFFVGGLTNVTYWLDAHVNSWRRNKVAYVWEGEPTDGGGNPLEIRKITWFELWREVNRVADALRRLGVGRGDRVAIYMPMVPEAIVTALASARLGAIHVIIFSGFGPEAMATRLSDSGAKVLVTADGGYRRGRVIDLKANVDKALGNVKCVERVVVFRRLGRRVELVSGRDVLWDDLLREVPRSAYVEPQWVEANEPVYIVYTSGTTGKPKGIVHASYHFVYTWFFLRNALDLSEENAPKDVFWFTGDIGWAAGHWYTIYVPLMFGLTAVIYEGAPDFPRPDRVWSIIERHGVTVFFTSATLIRLMMSYGEEWARRHDLSSIRIIASTGETLNAEAWRWLFNLLGKPIIDAYGHTETSGLIFAPYAIEKMTLKPGSATVPAPGIEPIVLDDEGKPARPGQMGHLVFKVPFKAPAIFLTIWGDVENFGKPNWRGNVELVRKVYYERFPGYFFPGDAAMVDEDGYYWILGRTDDVLKIAGHRIGTAEIEDALLRHEAVGEAAVVGKPDPIRGEVAVAFVVLKPGHYPSEKLIKEIKDAVKSVIGPIAIVDSVYFVNKLPKNRSGKVMRRVLRALLRGEDVGDVSTMEDPEVIEQLRALLRGTRD